MAYRDLRDFIKLLENTGELRRIKTEVDLELEVTEILDRLVKSNGPAVLFENVKGFDIPILANIFGSMERIKVALEVEELENIGQGIVELIKPKVPSGLVGKIKGVSKLKDVLSIPPKVVKSGHCKDIILKGDDVDLTKFPIPKFWPKDGGRFITLPLIFTKDPETGERNVGMYRMQVFDAKTTGMHWQIQKHGAEHYRKAEEIGKPLEVAVALGGDPATMLSAAMPLPDGFDEMVFAGILRKKPVELVKCETVDLEVPANAEIVLEGYIDPNERRSEGPFGDHTGYYSLPDLFPVFHVTCITHREKPIYPATLTGRPPKEDSYMGKAIERMFLPLIRFQLPEIRDINLPIESAVHNLCIVSIKKRYPGQAKKVMFALWGLGQLSSTKCIVVVDEDVNIQDLGEVTWAVSTRIDPKRDIIVIDRAPVDTLDHAAPLPNLGSKIGIDATMKGRDEGHEREWPEALNMSPDVVDLVDRRWKEYNM